MSSHGHESSPTRSGITLEDTTHHRISSVKAQSLWLSRLVTTRWTHLSSLKRFDEDENDVRVSCCSALLLSQF